MGVVVCGVVGYRASHGHWAMFYSDKGLIMVFGGTLSVIFMAMPGDKLKCVVGFLRAFMFHRARNPSEIINLMVSLGEKSRRDGLLALEADLQKIKDPFLTTGLRLVIDGSPPETIESILRMQLLAMAERHKAGKKFFDLIKLYGPGYGLVATLIGQVGMFGQLGGSIEAMGHMLAVAVVATMYGALIANAVAGPIGDKLGLRSSEEMLNGEMMMQGLLSLQSGDNPRVTMEKMITFIPYSSRQKMKLAA